MKEVFDKISPYDILNNILPGSALIIIFDRCFKEYSFGSAQVIENVFLYYLAGLLASRVGSLIVEPRLKVWGVIQYSPYNEFIQAERIDEKVATLSTINNMYRTFVSVFFILFLFNFYHFIINGSGFASFLTRFILFVLLFIISIFSYKKQTYLIKKRVSVIIEQSKKIEEAV